MRRALTASTALALALAPIAAIAASTLPPATLYKLGARPVWVPICSRRGVNGSGPVYDSTNTAVNDQVGCTSPSWGTVSAVKLMYAAFDMPQAGEVDRPVTATATASVWVPTNDNNTLLLLSGVSSGATTLTFSGNAQGGNGIGVGQTLYSSTGFLPTGDYITAISAAYSASNLPGTVTVTLSAATTGAIATGGAIALNGQFIPARFAGSRTVVIAPGHDVVTSDPMGVQLAPGTLFFARTAASFSGVGMQIADYPGAGSRITGLALAANSINEFDARSTSLTDHTLDPTTQGNSGGGYWGPVAVLGLVTPSVGVTAPGAVLILGDSIATGTGDIANSLYLQGYLQRALGNAVPFITAARGSTTAYNLAARGDGQFALTVDDGITDVMIEDGRNDIQQFGVSAASLESTIAQIGARYVNAGKRVWCFTVPPTTISSDGWTTLANQSWIMTAYTANGAVASGAGSIVLSGSSSLAIGQTVVAPLQSQSASAAVASGATTITLGSVTGVATGKAVYGPGISAGTTITGITSNTITLSVGASAAEPANTGFTFGGSIAPGTTITSLVGGTIQLSSPTVGTIASGATIDTGQAAANAAEAQRETYNAYLRSSFGALGCAGVVDADAAMADLGGSYKWRVDLGAASIEGVHPNAALHTAAIAKVPVTYITRTGVRG